jgi:hypothetical protein
MHPRLRVGAPTAPERALSSVTARRVILGRTVEKAKATGELLG